MVEDPVEETKSGEVPKGSMIEIQTKALDSNSCFPWFVLTGKSALRNVVPDYEIKRCKLVFSEVLSKGAEIPEAHFGLGKLQAHEGNFKHALRQIGMALEKAAGDPLYITWQAVMLTCECGKTVAKAEAMQALRLLEGLLSQGFQSIELYWCLMELALLNTLKVNIEIEEAKYYATKIKEMDTYYGYLAWARAYAGLNEPRKCTDVLAELSKTFPENPEAYILLWNFYYHKAPDFIKALDVSERAFVKAAHYDTQLYRPIIALMYAKSLNKTDRQKACFELLQHEYLEHPTFPVFLYQYGRLCVKAGDDHFIGSAIAALTECTRVCTDERFPCILFWLAKAYLEGKYFVQAVETMKKALKQLENTGELKKIKFLKSELNALNSFVVSYETLTRALSSTLTIEQIEESRVNCKINIEPVDRLTSDILIAKLLWSEGRQEDALRFIEQSCQNADLRLDGYVAWLRMLKELGEFERMKAVSKAMVTKCKNKQVPAPVWAEAHIIYSKCLALCKETIKSFAVLKCLAKILPPLPISDIPYTKLLQQANSVQDLTAASIKVLQFSPQNQSYTTFRNPFLNVISEDYSAPPSLNPKAEELGSEVLKLPTMLDSEEAKDQAHKRGASHAAEPFNRQRMKSPFNSLTVVSEVEDVETKEILTSRRRANDSYYEVVNCPTGVGAAVGFSVCSDPKFLYKIGKVAAKSSMCLQDGLLALHDYLVIKHYQMKEGNEVWEEEVAKAKYWKAELHFQSREYQ